MKKALLFLLLLLILPFAKAQNNFSIDLLGGAGHTFVTKSLQNQSWQNNNKFFLGGRFGGNIAYHFDEQNLLKSGLRVSTTGYKSYVTGIRWGSEHDGFGGWKPDPKLTHEGIFAFRDFWLELPLIFHHNFKQKTWTPYVEIGVLFNTLLGSHSRNPGENVGDSPSSGFTTQKPFNRFAIGTIASLGFERNFTKNKTFFVQYSFNTNVFATGQVLVSRRLSFVKSGVLLAFETGVRFLL